MVGAQGLLGYGLASVFGAIPAEVFPGKQYGTIVGTLNVASNAGAACGPWITGVLYDTTGTYATSVRGRHGREPGLHPGHVDRRAPAKCGSSPAKALGYGPQGQPSEVRWSIR